MVALLAGARRVSLAPAQAAEEMRAVDCCAHRCAKHALPKGPAQCCGVDRTDSAATLSAPQDPTAPAFAVAPAALVVALPAGASFPMPARGSGSRAGPLFLTLRSLRC